MIVAVSNVVEDKFVKKISNSNNYLQRCNYWATNENYAVTDRAPGALPNATSFLFVAQSTAILA